MNIKVFQNRKIERDYFYNEGTQNENNITVLTFEVPLGYEDFSKRIVFITEDGNFWDYIPENQYELKNNITKYGKVEAYLWLTKDEQDFRSETFELNFFKNENADDLIPTEEQIDGFNTLIAELEVKINEINELKPELDKALEKIENYDTDLQGIKSDIAKRLTEEDAKEIFYTETEVDEMVKEIQETNEYQSEIIDQFKNEFKQITVSGDSIYIPDAAELPIDLVPYGEPVQTVIPEELGNTVEGSTVVISDGDVNKEVKATVNGNSYQETTEGYQLLNELLIREPDKEKVNYNDSGLNITVLSKGGVKIVGASTKQLDFYLTSESYGNTKENIILDTSQQYTLKIVGNTFGAILAIGNGTASEQTASTKIITPTFNISWWFIRIPAGVTVDTVVYPMLYKGTDNKPYEPYTNGVATPNTEYKQDIEEITECSLVQRGKNIFKPTLQVDNESITINNATLTLTEDEYTFVATGADMYCGAILNKGAAYQKDRGILYNVKGKSKIHYLFTNDIFKKNYITFYDSNKISLGYSNTLSNSGSYDIPKDAEYMNLRFGYGNATVGETYKTKVMLSFEEITDYEKYIEPKTIEIDLAGEKLAKVTLEDKLIIGANGSVTAKKNTKEYILTGDETSLIENYVTKGLFQITLDNVSTDLASVRVKSNYLKGEPGYIIVPPEAENYLVSTYSGNRIFFRIDDFANNIDGFRAWLKEKYNAGEPMKVLYELATPEVIDLPNISPIELIEGITNIFELVTNLGTTVSMTYNYVTPSPSIDRPSEILTVGGTIESNDGMVDFSNPDVIETSDITYTFENNTITQKSFNSTGTVEWDILDIVKANPGKSIPFTYDNLNFEQAMGYKIEAYIVNNGTKTTTVISQDGIEDAPLVIPDDVSGITEAYFIINTCAFKESVYWTLIIENPSFGFGGAEAKGIEYETVIGNANLFDIPDVPETTRNGITYSISNNKFRANGTATTGISISIMKDFKFKKGTYTHSINKQKQDVYFSFDNLSDTMIGYIKTRTFALKEDITYSKYHIWVNEGVTFNNEEFEIQVQTGSTATPYTPHKSTTLPLTVGNELLGEIVTLTKEQADALNLDGAGKYIKTNYGRYVFTGNEWFLKNPTYTGYRFYNTDIIKNATHPTSNTSVWDAYSNMFAIGTPENTYFSVECISYDANNTALYICCERFATVDELQAFLKSLYNAGTPMEIIYPLANPTYTKITDENQLEQLKAYDKQIAFFGVNNINTYLVDDVNKGPLKIHATYSKSNKLTIQSLEDRLASLESQVTNLQDNQI